MFWYDHLRKDKNFNSDFLMFHLHFVVCGTSQVSLHFNVVLYFCMFPLVYQILNSCCKTRKSRGVFGGNWRGGGVGGGRGRKSISPQAKALCNLDWGSFILSQWDWAFSEKLCPFFPSIFQLNKVQAQLIYIYLRLIM